MNELIAIGDEVKATKLDNGDVRLGGYLIRFADDSTPDLTGDYFTKNTDFGEANQSLGWFNHRMPVEFEGKRIRHKEQLPIVELTKDNIGVFAEIVIGARNEYERTIAELGMKGKLSWSSGTAPHLVERKSVKNAQEITLWKLGLDASLTPTPAEPRSTNNLVTIKSLMEHNEMDTNEIKSAVDEAVKSALAAKAEADKAEAEKLAAIKSAEEAGYQKAIKDVADRKAPAFNTKTELGFSEEKDAVPAFKHWLGTGQTNGGLIKPDSTWEAKSAFNAGVTSAATGGYLVPDPMYNQIIAKRNIQSFIRQLPYQSFVTPSDHILVNVEDTSATAFVATAELAAYDENEPTFAQKDIILYKYTKAVRATEEFMSYNNSNFDAWLMDVFARAESTLENTIFLTGNGTTQPQGVLTGATSGNVVTTSAVLVPADVSALIGKLGAGYNVQGQTGLVMQNATKWYLKGLPTNAAFAFSPTPNDFFGQPVVINDNMSAYTVASSAGKSMLFGNWNYYGVAEKPGMMVQRNPYLYMATGEIGIFASVFRGGAVLQSEAFYHSVGK